MTEAEVLQKIKDLEAALDETVQSGSTGDQSATTRASADLQKRVRKYRAELALINPATYGNLKPIRRTKARL